MANTLYLRFHEDSDNPVSWQVTTGIAAEATQTSGRGTLEEAALAAEGKRAILLAPGVDTLLVNPSLPIQNRQRLLQAVPFALENQLASDIESSHFTIGKRQEDETTPVAVVSHLKMESWIDKLEAVGIRPSAIHPEILCLPYSDGEWSILADNEIVLVRTGGYTGFAIDPGNAQQVLELLLERVDETQPDKLNIYCTKEAENLFDESRLGELNCEVTITPCDQPLQLLADNCNPQRSHNLLHTRYRLDTGQQLIWRSWYPAMAVGLVVLILTVTTSTLEYRTLSKQETELKQQIEQLFRQTFPETKRIINPQAQMTQKLKELQASGSSSSGFLELLNLSGKAIKQQSTAGLEGISYREGQLDIQLTIRDLQLLDQLKQQLEQSQLSVEIRSANAQKNQVKAHLQVRRANT